MTSFSLGRGRKGGKGPPNLSLIGKGKEKRAHEIFAGKKGMSRKRRKKEGDSSPTLSMKEEEGEGKGKKALIFFIFKRKEKGGGFLLIFPVGRKEEKKVFLPKEKGVRERDPHNFTTKGKKGRKKKNLVLFKIYRGGRGGREDMGEEVNFYLRGGKPQSSLRGRKGEGRSIEKKLSSLTQHNKRKKRKRKKVCLLLK